MYSPSPAETIIHGGRIATLDRARPFVSAGYRPRASAGDRGPRPAGRAPHRRDGHDRRAGTYGHPGVNDSHLHIVREGLTYNMELRWDRVPSLADTLRMLRRQAERVRVSRTAGYAIHYPRVGPGRPLLAGHGPGEEHRGAAVVVTRVADGEDIDQSVVAERGRERVNLRHATPSIRATLSRLR